MARSTAAVAMILGVASALACAAGVHAARPRPTGAVVVDETKSRVGGGGTDDYLLLAALNHSSSSSRPLVHHRHRRHLTQGLRGGGLVDVDVVDARYDRLEQSGNKIPKILHLLWVTHQLPRFAEGYKRSWLENHPGWRVIQWTDESMLNFVREHFPRDVSMWHSFPTGVFRADTFRYMVLRVIGGVYVDLDMESLRPVDPLLTGHTCLLGQEPSAHARLMVNKPRHICNAWMASAVGEPFWWGGAGGGCITSTVL